MANWDLLPYLEGKAYPRAVYIPMVPPSTEPDWATRQYKIVRVWLQDNIKLAS